MAKVYSVFATGGKALDLREETLRAITVPAIRPSTGWRYAVLLVDQRYALGFLRPFERASFGLSERAFGFGGAGGSFAFADPEAGVGYAYAPNKMGVSAFGDPREVALRRAFYGCLGWGQRGG